MRRRNMLMLRMMVRRKFDNVEEENVEEDDEKDDLRKMKWMMMMMMMTMMMLWKMRWRMIMSRGRKMMMSRGGGWWCWEWWCGGGGGRWWCWRTWCGGGGPIPRPRPTLCVSLRGGNARGDFTRATWYGNLQVKCRGPAVDQDPDTHTHTFCASLRNRHTLGNCTRVARAHLQGKWGKCRAPKPGHTLCASLRNRNSLGDFTRATLYENFTLQLRFSWSVWINQLPMHFRIIPERKEKSQFLVKKKNIYISFLQVEIQISTN